MKSGDIHLEAKLARLAVFDKYNSKMLIENVPELSNGFIKRYKFMNIEARGAINKDFKMIEFYREKNDKDSYWHWTFKDILTTEDCAFISERLKANPFKDIRRVI